MKENWKLPFAESLLIVVLTAVVYMPVFEGGFVWDDKLYVSNNPLIKGGDGLRRIWFTTESVDYYPLTESLWWLEWHSWGDHPAGYHMTNILLHAINALLVFLILRRLEIPGAWLAGLVFAIHPVNVATVAWISEQKNTLSMLFYALSILLYLRFDAEKRWHWYALSLAAFLLAMLSKTAVVMLPVVLLGCLWWMHRTVRRKDLLCSAPFFVLSLVLGLVTVWFQYHQVLRGNTFGPPDFPSRLAVAGAVPWFYLSKAVLPFRLTAVYPRWEVDALPGISYLPGVILVVGFTVFWWKRTTWGRPILFALGYFVVMLLPVLSFIDQGFYQYSLVADHWQYYSIVGIIALGVAVGERVVRRMGDRTQNFEVLASVAVVAVLGTVSWTRSGVYTNNETLWQDTITKNPKAWLAYNNLGVVRDQSGAHAEAIRYYEQALRMKPDYALAHNNLGIALERLGRSSDAIDQYEQALRTNPRLAEVHNNLGAALLRQGRSREAVQHWEQALQINPDYANAHFNLGVIVGQAGKSQEAIRHYEQVLRIKPDYVEAENNLAWLLATRAPVEGGDPSRAVGLAQRACERTGYRIAVNVDTLAVAYAAAGRFAEAVDAAQQAIGLARSEGQTPLVREMEARLGLYRSGRVYHEATNMTTAPVGP